MASSDDSPPHGKTRLVQKFTAAEFGPLNVCEDLERRISDFRGGSYRLTTPSDNGVVLHRLYGGEAKEVGQYWTVEPRAGNLSYQLDYAMVPSWGSTLAESTTLFVPPGIMLYEGYAGPQNNPRGSSSFGGGGWQIFIPKSVVEPLMRAQKATKSQAAEAVREALKQQSNILEKYDEQIKKLCEKRVKEFCTLENAQELLKRGSGLANIPQETKQVLQSESLSDSERTGEKPSNIPTGNYVLHRQDIALPNGRTTSVSLRVRLEFSHQTTRTTQSGNTIITITTKYYNRIFEWV